MTIGTEPPTNLPDAAFTAGPKDPPSAHVRARLDAQTRELLAQEEGARAGADPEFVHEMRVAVRRMRAVLKTGGATALGAPAQRLREELRWFGGVLGEVRDLDVLLDHLRSVAADFDETDRAAAERLLTGLVVRRRAARRRMLAALRATRYRQLIESVAVLVGTPVRGESTDHPKRRLVGVVTKPYRGLAKAAKALADDCPDDDLHALRIRGKRLRYAAELTVPTVGKPAKKLVKATKSMQDVLGDHQDATVAVEVLLGLVETAELDAGAVFVAGRLVEREHARKAWCRAHWRTTMADVHDAAATLVS